MDSQTTKEQYLGLKVMRLLKPSLNEQLPLYDQEINTSTRYLFEEIFSVNDSNLTKSNINFNYSDFFVLPQSFGNIFIGETFSSYLCIHNHSDAIVRQMEVKIELQTKAQKIPIPLTSRQGEHVDTFGPDETFDGLIHYAIKELGLHVLICIVNYSTENDEKMSFKKFFKFSVSKPFEIQPRLPYLKNDKTVLFEAAIQNVTNNNLFIDKVALEDITQFNVECLNETILNDDFKNNKYSITKLLKPTELRQYLYKITAQNGESIEKSQINGKLFISWRNPYSDIGHLTTNSVYQQDAISINRKDLDISIEDLDEICFVGKKIYLTLKLKNVFDRALELTVQLKNDTNFGYFWDCVLDFRDIKILPNEVYSLKVSLLPFKSGFIDINGILITDVFLKRLYEASNLTSIFVLDSQTD